MCKPSQYINDICNNCNPQTYDMTLAKYAGQENTIEVIDRFEGNYEIKEYLYECCGCGTQAWADEDWVKRNAVAEESLEKFTNLKGDEDMTVKKMIAELETKCRSSKGYMGVDFDGVKSVEDLIDNVEVEISSIEINLGVGYAGIRFEEDLFGMTIREAKGYLTRLNNFLKRHSAVNTCTFCGREDDCDTKIVGGYTILEICADCEGEILEDE